MTLVTLLGGWIPVTLLFLAFTWARTRTLAGPAVVTGVVESSVLTLLAGLWFGSLGHGGWLAVFSLIGVLAATIERGTQTAFPRSAFTREAALAALTVARYVGAGALLAWLLA